jgi:hypothetical protein
MGELRRTDLGDFHCHADFPRASRRSPHLPANCLNRIRTKTTTITPTLSLTHTHQADSTPESLATNQATDIVFRTLYLEARNGDPQGQLLTTLLVCQRLKQRIISCSAPSRRPITPVNLARS